jgi:hypothetical protein
MADDNPNKPRTLGGGNPSDPVPSSWPRPAASSAPRIGRIGGWGGGGSTCVSYHITISISLTPNSYIWYEHTVVVVVAGVVSRLWATTATMGTTSRRTILQAVREGNLLSRWILILIITSFVSFAVESMSRIRIEILKSPVVILCAIF